MIRFRVLVADDHRIFAEGLCALLEPEFAVVCLVECGKAMVDAWITLRPDVIDIDIRMVSLNGTETASRLSN